MRIQLVTTLLLVAASVLPVSADEITVKDTAGSVRSIAEVGNEGSIEFSLVDELGRPADGTEILLTGAGGEVYRAVAVNGLVIFEQLPPGVYTVASAAPGITFTNITISPAMLAAGGGLSSGNVAGGWTAPTTESLLIGGGIVTVGAATAIGISQSSSSGKSDPVLSPSN